MLQSQNLQIEHLIKSNESLHIQYNSVLNSIHDLKVSISQKDTTLNELQTKLNQLPPSSNLITEVDAEMFRALTERRTFYIQLAFCVLGAVAVTYGGFYMFGKVVSPFVFISSKTTAFAQKYGFLNDIETYSKSFEGTLWQFKIINKGKDIQTNVKIPGGGDFVDGFKLVNDLVKQVHYYSSNVPTQPLFPCNTKVLPDTLSLVGKITPMSNSLTVTDQTLSQVVTQAATPLIHTVTDQVSTQVATQTVDTVNQLIVHGPVLKSVVDIMSNIPS